MMEVEMRRKDRKLSTEEARQILQNGMYGVLSIMGDDGYPYGVPLHYVMIDDSVYFHCTKKGGYKISCLQRNPKISFTVVETKDYVKCKSVIFFGTATPVMEMEGKVLEKMVEKFVPQMAWEQAKCGIPYSKDVIFAYKLEISHISAKFIDKPAGK